MSNRPTTKEPRTPLLTSLKRSQVAAALASAADYSTLLVLVELVRVWYVIGIAAGGTVGAITNFMLGRAWSFEATHGPVLKQALRYAITSGLSILLNTCGVFILKEYFHAPYLASKILISICVGLFFNFPMHRNFVFK
jgi:putative flippase GtrA